MGKKCCRQQKKLLRLVKAAKKAVQKSETRKKSVLVYIVIFFGSISFVNSFFSKFKISKVMHRLIRRLSFLLACFHSLNFRIIYYVSVAFFITCAFLIKWYFICKSFSLLDTDSPHRNSNCSKCSITKSCCVHPKKHFYNVICLFLHWIRNRHHNIEGIFRNIHI